VAESWTGLKQMPSFSEALVAPQHWACAPSQEPCKVMVEQHGELSGLGHWTLPHSSVPASHVPQAREPAGNSVLASSPDTPWLLPDTQGHLARLSSCRNTMGGRTVTDKLLWVSTGRHGGEHPINRWGAGGSRHPGVASRIHSSVLCCLPGTPFSSEQTIPLLFPEATLHL
jgi:hypothetical protein